MLKTSFLEDVKPWGFRLMLLTLTILYSPSLLAADSLLAEHFTKAVSYTVKVRTLVEYPFVKDNKGSFSGAGFLISKNRGWILTNAHVSSRNPERIEIAFKGKNFVEARLVYVDQLLDIAVLELSTEQIPKEAQEADIECDNDPIVGSPVGAYGHPFGLSFSGTRGIVSGTRYKWGRYMVQTDAAINSGNSGGPLISLDNGKVIGINASTFSKQMSEGIGFAVPMIHACSLIKILHSNRNPSPPYIPVSFANDTDNEEQFRVAFVYENQPVRWALQPNDLLVSLADTPEKILKNQSDLLDVLRGLEGKVRLIIERKGVRKAIWVSVRPRPSLMKRVGIHFSGIVIGNEPMKDDELINPQKLMFVHDISHASIGAMSGVRPFSYLVSVDGKNFGSPIALCRYLKPIQLAKAKTIIITRQIAWEYNSRTKYRSHEINIDDVRLVGPGKLASCD